MALVNTWTAAVEVGGNAMGVMCRLMYGVPIP